MSEIDVDSLPPTQYLILEVLAARWRTGEQSWPFPNRLRPQLQALAEAGLVDWRSGPEPGWVQAWLTKTGGDAAMSRTYKRPPSPESQPGVLSWDWRGQPDLVDLARILRDVSGGTVHLREINTGSDEYAVVIAATDLDEATAQAVYERRHESGDDTADRRS